MFMKILVSLLIFLLPLHAFIITVLKCKYGIDTNILRFWKEITLCTLWIIILYRIYSSGSSVRKIYKNNTLLWLISIFIACCAIYMYFPFFELKAASVLWFRYDAFFFIAMIAWLYSGLLWDLRSIIKMLFISTFGILIIFLPWYIFGDISSLAVKFWYSAEVSTYTANSCISFAQNVDGQHRFQGTFWWPIRFSVFLTIVGSLFAGWLLSSTRFTRKQQYLLGAGFASLIIPAIFFSYSKTSILGAMFAIWTFILLSYKYIYRKKITKKFYSYVWVSLMSPILLVAVFKWELFLHFWAVLNRLENLGKSVEMFFYNPYGYGLGIAGPASQIGNSIESAWSWQVATATVLRVHKFLPENWYVQIALEMWIIGISIFMALIILIGYRLIDLIKRKRDYMSVWITTAYFALLFMALFTHAFEEAATSYVLFLIIGVVLAESMKIEQTQKK